METTHPLGLLIFAILLAGACLTIYGAGLRLIVLFVSDKRQRERWKQESRIMLLLAAATVVLFVMTVIVFPIAVVD